ncbi:MAG: hypothetical protein Q4D91_15385, partial [Lautropia sp.]|nr:hypothetical protein [Lautropia sp.]
MEAIHYSIFPVDPGAHLFEVMLWIENPAPEGQRLSLPTWIPGSYLIREFARHIDRVSAFSLRKAPGWLLSPGTDRPHGRPSAEAQGRTSKRKAPQAVGIQQPVAPLLPLPSGTAWEPATALGTSAVPVPIRKIDKNTWCCDPVGRQGDGLLLHYQVYAWDLSVRAAHLDGSHGFFNGSSVFLCVRGQEAAPCSVDILPPAGSRYADWRVATTLPLSGPAIRGSVSGHHDGGPFGRYRAADYDELIDHPVEMGMFQYASFETGGCLHELAITGRAEVDFERLIRDLKPICQTQIELFEPKRRRAPVDRYLFMTMAVGDGYG